MTHLLDTSVWLMIALRPQMLPDDIEEIIADTGETLGLSIFSLWEVAKKNQQGKLTLPVDLPAWLKAAASPQIHVLPLTADIIVESTRLPEFPVKAPPINSSWPPRAATSSRC